MKTHCCHCVFYSKQEKNCHLNLLEKAKVTMTEEGPEVDGLCRSIRNIYWTELKDGRSMPELADKVREENKVKFDVVIAFDLKDEIKELYQTIDSINNFDIKPQTVIVSSNRHYLLNQSLWADLTSRYSELKFIVNFCGYDSYESLLNYSLNKVTSEFVVNTVCGCLLENKLINALNEQINTPSSYLAYYKDSNCYVAETEILRYSILNKPQDVSTLDYIKQNMNNIGTVYELT